MNKTSVALLLTGLVCAAGGAFMLMAGSVHNAYIWYGAWGLFSLAAAVILYGVVDPAAEAHVVLKGIQIGGAPAAFVAILLVGYRVQPDPAPLHSQFSASILLDGQIAPDGTVVKLVGSGLAENTRTLESRHNGRVTFDALRDMGPDVSLEITVPGFEPRTVRIRVAAEEVQTVELLREQLVSTESARSDPPTLHSQITTPVDTPYGLSAPPLLSIQVVESSAPSQVALRAKLGKTRLGRDRALQIDLDAEGNVLAATQNGVPVYGLDTGKYIDESFAEFPHAHYHFEAWLPDHAGSQIIDRFNYVYREPFVCDETTFSSGGEEFTPILNEDGEHGGVRIDASAKSKGDLTHGRVRREYDFTGGYTVSGSFVLSSVGDSRPVVGIALGDEWGDRLLVLFGERTDNGFTIKYMGESNEEALFTRSPTVSVKRDGITRHYFELKFSRLDADHIECSVRLHLRGKPDASHEVARRVFRYNDLHWESYGRARLQLWNKGIAEVFDFVLAEHLPSDARWHASANTPEHRDSILDAVLSALDRQPSETVLGGARVP